MESILILPKTKCNVSCDYCGQDKKIKNKEMDDSVLEKLLLEIKEKDIEKVMISGGEITTPDYSNRLFKILRNTKIGKEKKIILETNGWWGKTKKSAKDMFDEFEKANVSSILLSTDYFHTQFIPIKSLANIIRESNDYPVEINSINMRSFKSTYEKDIELIKELSNELGIKISRTQMIYQSNSQPYIRIPLLSEEENEKMMKGRLGLRTIKKIFNFFSPAMSISSTTKDGLFNVFDHEGGFEGLRDVNQVVYSLGENSHYSMLGGASGINLVQMWAIRTGCAKEKIAKNDVIKPIYPGIINYIINSKNKKIFYHPELKNPAILPDGSLISDCAWNFINDYKRARLGKYPKMNLTEFERVSKSRLFGFGKFYWDMINYLPSVAIDYLSQKIRKN